jgi:(p)ppGpp synthase/HD superfamily hydrolase
MRVEPAIIGHDLVARARAFARRHHRGALARDGVTPYFEHVAAVAALVARAGGGDALIAAAYLHDIVEDTAIELPEIRDRFGADVATIVGHLTDRTLDPVSGVALDWVGRKRLTVCAVVAASDETALVKAADLCVNIDTLLDLHEQVGEATWSLYEADAAAVTGYYLTVGAALLARPSAGPLADAVRGRCRHLETLARAIAVEPAFPS